MAVKKEVAIATIEKAKTALDGLPKKLPAAKPVDAALLDLKPSIVGLLDRGYSRAEVVELLVKQGVPVKAYHLKALLGKKQAETEEGA